MAEGFIADHTHGAFAVSNWVEGQPKKSMWTGVQLTGKARSEISTWRCRRCGFLESYAAGEPNLAEEAKTRSQVRVALVVVSVITVITVAVALALNLG
jgi:hypothetical protein